MPITITDVAARAGVSSATVSRVLQGSPRVSRAALERVQAAIAELEYRPSGVARSLRSQQTGTLGLIVTNITNPFYPEIVRGAEDAAQRMGASIILCNAAEDPEREIAYLDLLLERRVDGVIVAAGGLTQRHEDFLSAFPSPLVLVNAALPGGQVPAVLSDDEGGGRAAAAHVLELGHTRLIHISGPAVREAVSLRLDGVRAAIAAADADVTLEVVEGDGYLAGGLAARAGRRASPASVRDHRPQRPDGRRRDACAFRPRDPRPGRGQRDRVRRHRARRVHEPGLDHHCAGQVRDGPPGGRDDRPTRSGEAVKGDQVLPVRLVVRGSTGPAH